MVVTIDEVVDIGLVGLRLIVADLQNRIHITISPFFVGFNYYTPELHGCKGEFL